MLYFVIKIVMYEREREMIWTIVKYSNTKAIST
jgi:hypothetical protein